MAQHRETAQHRAAFETWYALNRDFRETSLKLAKPDRSVREWADRFGWHERADRRDIKAGEQAEREAIARKSAMIEAQRKVGQALRTLGGNYLATNGNKSVTSLKDAISAIKEGFTLERQAEGLPDWVGTILNASDDDLRNQYAELERAMQEKAREPGGTEAARHLD